MPAEDDQSKGGVESRKEPVESSQAAMQAVGDVSSWRGEVTGVAAVELVSAVSESAPSVSQIAYVVAATTIAASATKSDMME